MTSRHEGIYICEIDEKISSKLLLQYPVVILKNKFSFKKELEEWLTIFGKLDSEHSIYYNDKSNVLTLKSKDRKIPPGGVPYLSTFSGSWHYDGSFLDPKENLYSAIHAHNPAIVGGDTIFSNTGMAFKDLSDCYKKFLRKLKIKTVNRNNDSFTSKSIIDHKEQYIRELDVPPITTNLIYKDKTGNEFIKISPRGMLTIDGMHEEEAKPILNFLSTHCTRPEYCYRHTYETNQTVLFCNNRIIHYGVFDYNVNDRELWQVRFSI